MCTLAASHGGLVAEWWIQILSSRNGWVSSHQKKQTFPEQTIVGSPLAFLLLWQFIYIYLFYILKILHVFYFRKAVICAQIYIFRPKKCNLAYKLLFERLLRGEKKKGLFIWATLYLHLCKYSRLFIGELSKELRAVRPRVKGKQKHINTVGKPRDKTGKVFSLLWGKVMWKQSSAHYSVSNNTIFQYNIANQI